MRKKFHAASIGPERTHYLAYNNDNLEGVDSFSGIAPSEDSHELHCLMGESSLINYVIR